ncbi:kinase/pyrophosphorylase, partial [Staphylococcus epidermidis]|uniref:kinase/pyrophosphorylase n=1 Tax=Staphylococcus epidermidis TaxID=1282 RepID=UPI0034D96B34
MQTPPFPNLNHQYFNPIQPIHYSLKYHHPNHFTHIRQPDPLILPLSPTSKTPLTIYLPNKPYNIPNIPLLPQLAIP